MAFDTVRPPRGPQAVCVSDVSDSRGALSIPVFFCLQAKVVGQVTLTLPATIAATVLVATLTKLPSCVWPSRLDDENDVATGRSKRCS